MLVPLGQVAVALDGALPRQFAGGVGAERRIVDLGMELEDSVALAGKLLRTHGHRHLDMIDIPLSPLPAVHPHTAVAHEVFVFQIIQGMHDGTAGTHMCAVRIHQVVVKEDLVRF